MFRVKKGVSIATPTCVTETSLDESTVKQVDSVEFGDQGVDGAWKVILVDTDLLFKRRESSVFVTKLTMDLSEGGVNSGQPDSESGTLFEDNVNSTKARFVIRDSDDEIFSIQFFNSPNWDYIIESLPTSPAVNCRQWRLKRVGNNLELQYQNDGSTWVTDLEVTP